MPATYELVAVARTPQQSGPPTLVELGPIIAPTITWTHEINRAGTIGFSCTANRMSDDIAFRFRDLAAHPTEVWLYRDGTLVSAGLVNTYQIQGASLSVTAPGLFGYLAYMAVHSDLSFVSVDQFAIAKSLVDQWQSLDYGHFGIDTSSVGASGILRDRSYIAAEQHWVDERIRQLGQAADGFDAHVDPATRALVLTNPSRGNDLTGSVILDARNITDAGVSVSVAPGDLATDAFGVGGDGDVALASTQTNLSLQATWGRAAVMESFDGVTVQGTLDQHTQALLDARDSALLLPGPGLLPVGGADVDDFDIGDLVGYEFDAGIGVQSGSFRVVSREVSIDEDGVESMAVSFA